MKTLDEYFREEEAKRVVAMHSPEGEAEFARVTEANRKKAARELAAVGTSTPYQQGEDAYLRGDAYEDCPVFDSAMDTEDWQRGWTDTYNSCEE